MNYVDSNSMHLLRVSCFAVACAAHTVVCTAQGQTDKLKLEIPPVKTSLNLEGQPIGITVWGSVSEESAGVFRLAITADLRDLQENITPLLQAQLNRSDRCGERLSVERATLVPAAPSGLLKAYVHYERWGCVKAFGKEIVKRLAGGNGVVEVNLTPSVVANNVSLNAEVQKMDADGSLGEMLRSGSLGDSLREKIAAHIQSAIQKSADLKSTLPPEIESAATLQSVVFADGGAGQLWIVAAGVVGISPDQFRALAKQLLH